MFSISDLSTNEFEVAYVGDEGSFIFYTSECKFTIPRLIMLEQN